MPHRRKSLFIVVCVLCFVAVMLLVPSQSYAAKKSAKKSASAQKPVKNPLASLTNEELRAFAQKYLQLEDYAKASKYVLELSGRGDIASQTVAGMMYIDGLGVPHNENEGARLILKAAEKGYPEAQFRAGLCYADGIGVHQDSVMAITWLRLAEKNGHPQARELRENIEMSAALGMFGDMISPQRPVQNRGVSPGQNQNICPRCNGTGVCPVCYGYGGTPNVFTDGYQHCNACRDTGLCYTCRGAGVLH